MTEEDARKKWCPFVRWDPGSESGDPATNRHGSADHPIVASVAAYRCIASDCMAWRNDLAAPGVGYCGLAGAPTP